MMKLGSCSLTTMTIISLISLFSCLAASAQLPLEGASVSENRFTGLTGLTTIVEKNEKGESETFPFYRLNLRPELNLGKVGIGFDAVLLYNPDKGFRTEDGEKIKGKNLVRWVRTLRYGRRNDPIYFLYGALENVHIGYGLLMAGYYNYDRRGLRLDLNEKQKGLGGIETILNNVTDPNIFGGRVHISPLKNAISTSLIKELTFGGSYLTDVDPDPNDEGEDPLIAYSGDVGIPIIQRSLLTVNLYDELAFIKNYPEPWLEPKSAPKPKSKSIPILKSPELTTEAGSEAEETKSTFKGNATGIGVSLSGVNFKVEYRVFDEKFQPSIFDYVYEDLKRKGKLEVGASGTKGIYSLATYNLAKKIFLVGTYENYDKSPAKVQVEAVEADLVEKVNLRGLYIKRNIEGFKDIFDIDDKSAIRIEVGYEFMPPLQLVVDYDITFRQREDEKGFEQIRKVSAQLGVAAKF